MYTPGTLSDANLLLSIETSQEVVQQADQAALKARAVRDNQIVEALDRDVPYRTIQKLTGLSRSAIIKIQESPRRNITW